MSLVKPLPWAEPKTFNLLGKGYPGANRKFKLEILAALNA